MSTYYFKRILKKLRETAHTDYNCGGYGANEEAKCAIEDVKRIEALGRELTTLVADTFPQHTKLITTAQRVFGKRKT